MRIPKCIGRLAVLAMCCVQIPLVSAGLLDSLNNKVNAVMSDLPRYEKLPLFNPHRKDFTCVYQAQRVPTLDPQAEMWFQQALLLNDPNIVHVDHAKMYQLYLQAAGRNHWKAMLNLASLILGDDPAVPEHDPDAAIRWVEKAMGLGIPDAYDRMGVYHLNGVVKGGDATSAYAFFQRAAEMGSPAAMTFLGKKMDGEYDDPDGEFWGNLPVAQKMLECAVAQGYGEAAEELGMIYARPNTAAAKQKALQMLHEGVKLGCAGCASYLSAEFSGFDLSKGTNLIGHVDMAREQRYGKIADLLKAYQGRLKLPNLDKILPLPPATLPKWDGNVQTLISAAKAVALQQAVPATSGGREGRSYVPEGYAVGNMPGDSLAVAGNQWVPKTGFWLALYGSLTQPNSWLAARSGQPERYEAGERFEVAGYDWLSPEDVHWHYLGEAYLMPPQRADFVAHLADAAMLREVPDRPSRLLCSGNGRCPEAGIWEGRIAPDHAMAVLFNRWDQQAFVEKGERFPDARTRFIDVDTSAVQWTYLGSPNAETGMSGIREISL